MDFVYHEIFDMEKERIDLNKRIAWMGWKHQPVQRSFDAFQFVQVPDHGIVWKGMHTAYLTSAPAEHVRAARAARWRQIVFHGEVEELPRSVHRSVVDFSASQGRLGKLFLAYWNRLVYVFLTHVVINRPQGTIKNCCTSWNVQPWQYLFSERCAPVLDCLCTYPEILSS